MEEEQDQEQVALEELGETREVESQKTINPMILKVRDSTLGEMRQWLRSQV